MRRGRKTKPPIDELRASFWYWALKEGATQEASQKMSDEKLARFFRRKLRGNTTLVDPKQLGHYRRGETNPSELTLEYAEGLYPGTRMFFESGPWFSYLWVALDPSGYPQDTLTAIETTWRTGVRVEHQAQIGGKQGIQDVIVPAELAARWNVKRGARLNLAEKCQPWERLDDVCAQVATPDFDYETYAAGGILTFAPSATFGKDERLNEGPEVRLPFFAGFGYQIALARASGRSSFILNLAAQPPITRFSGRFLAQLEAKLKDVTWFHIILEQGHSFRLSKTPPTGLPNGNSS